MTQSFEAKKLRWDDALSRWIAKASSRVGQVAPTNFSCEISLMEPFIVALNHVAVLDD